jgi:hypothetical protein
MVGNGANGPDIIRISTEIPRKGPDSDPNSAAARYRPNGAPQTGRGSYDLDSNDYPRLVGGMHI